MKNTTWQQLQPGQVVSFQYKSQNKRSAKRYVLILDPRYPYRKKETNKIVEFVIGLEIDSSDKPALNRVKVKQLLKDLSIEDKGTQVQRMKNTYDSIKTFLKSNDIFRTYFLRECRRRRVFLQDEYDALNPIQMKQVSQELIKENKNKLEEA